MTYNKKILLLVLIIFGCMNKMESANDIWIKALEYRTENKLKESIENLKIIIEAYPSDTFAVMAQFQIADIYLNDIEDYEYAIQNFNKIVNNYPNNKLAKKSQFMIGYVYNNYLNAYSDAINNYKIFLDNYPNDDLIPSVEYELEELMKYKKTIDSLNTNIYE